VSKPDSGPGYYHNLPLLIGIDGVQACAGSGAGGVAATNATYANLQADIYNYNAFGITVSTATHADY
jgi:hypothetical protein